MYKWNGLEIQAEGEGNFTHIEPSDKPVGESAWPRSTDSGGRCISTNKIEYYRKELKHAYQNDSPGERERVFGKHCRLVAPRTGLASSLVQGLFPSGQ